MVINRELDYALRIIRDLSVADIMSAAELEKKESVPVAYVRKIVHKLSRADIVTVIRGPRGGYRLKKLPAELTLWSVSQALEEKIYINECLEDGYECTGSYRENCGIHLECIRIQKCLEQEMSKTPLSEIFFKGEAENAE